MCTPESIKALNQLNPCICDSIAQSIIVVVVVTVFVMLGEVGFGVGFLTSRAGVVGLGLGS